MNHTQPTAVGDYNWHGRFPTASWESLWDASVLPLHSCLRMMKAMFGFLIELRCSGVCNRKSEVSRECSSSNSIWIVFFKEGNQVYAHMWRYHRKQNKTRDVTNQYLWDKTRAFSKSKQQTQKSWINPEEVTPMCTGSFKALHVRRQHLWRRGNFYIWINVNQRTTTGLQNNSNYSKAHCMCRRYAAHSVMLSHKLLSQTSLKLFSACLEVAKHWCKSSNC